MAVAGGADPVAVEQMLAATLEDRTQVQATLAVLRAVAAGAQSRTTAGITAAALSAMNAASGPNGQGNSLAANAVTAVLTKPPHADRPAIIRRCQVDECNKLDVGGGKCTAHGGGKRCQVDGCNAGDRGGGRCISHGGGARQSDRCDAGAASGGKFCVTHGGGLRCTEEGCDRVRKVRGK